MRKTKLVKAHRGLMNDKVGVEIRRTWGDIPVTDATKDLRVFIAPEDVKAAKAKDPAYCVFAQACRRALHATKVLFFRGVAYIELPDAKGNRRVERFIMGNTMRALVESFDRGEGVIPSAGFVLRAPTKSATLEVESQARSDRKAAQRRRLDGESTGSGIGRGKGRSRDKPVLVDLSVRNGSGAVRFAKKVEVTDGG